MSIKERIANATVVRPFLQIPLGFAPSVSASLRDGAQASTRLALREHQQTGAARCLIVLTDHQFGFAFKFIRREMRASVGSRALPTQAKRSDPRACSRARAHADVEKL
ncbi:MAG: hypothetical protein ABI612_19800 [Betaproteobacteria bacterium]